MKWGLDNMLKEEKEIHDKDLEIIEGEFIKINRSRVTNVEGGHVEMQQVCALSIDGERIETTQTAALMLRGSDITLNHSASMATVSGSTNINYSFLPVSVSKGETTINRSAAGLIISRDLKAENSSALIVLANKVEGTLTTLLDLKTTVALGAVAGGLFGLLMLFRKK